MNTKTFLLSLLCLPQTMAAQSVQDSTDVFYRHLDLNEVTVTGLTGESHIKATPTPVSIMTYRDLQSTPSTNIIDAISHQPGISQITTGSGISKPVIRGLGFNRVAVVSDGIRQEGQQWGDEHGVEIDPHAVGQVEILKGPASLMYGSDAMAGVLIFHPHHVQPSGTMRATVSSGYQTNNGLFDYSINFAGHEQSFVWDGRWSQKMAHAYKNPDDGYVPGSQFAEQAARLMLGVNKGWGHSHLALSYYHLLPGIVEGERDALTGALLSEASSPTTYDESLPFQHVHHYKAVWDNALRLGNGQLKALVGYQQNRRQEYEESPDEYSLYFQLHTLNYDFRYQTEFADGWKMAVGTGGMYQRSENKGDEFLIPAYNLFDMGVFATAGKEWSRWNVTGGLRLDGRWLHNHELWDEGSLRFDDFSRRFTGLSASLGAVYAVLPSPADAPQSSAALNLRANLSHGFRAPNMSELGSNGVHEGTIRYEQGNHDLRPEHSWQLDLGADFSCRYLSAQIALFANRIGNYIYIHRTSEVIDAEHATYRYDAGDARLMGFEALVDLHPIHQLHFENTFGLVDAVQLHQPEPTKYLPFTPAPRWTAELKYEFSHEHRRLLDNSYVALGMECNLRQNHYYQADDTETATPSYTLFSLSAGTDVCLRGRHVASLYLTAQNLFDRVYQSHLSRLKYTDANPLTGRQGISGMGRSVCLRVVVPIVL